MPGTVDPPVWIDGAHNEDKIAALALEARRLFNPDPLPVIVFGMLRGKDPSSLLGKVGSTASSIVLTEPFVHGREPLAAATLADALSASGFAGRIHIELDPDAAVRGAEIIAKREGTAVLVTGSIYLAGQIRRRWFQDQDIVLQRTPWPTIRPECRLGLSGPFGGLVGDKTNRERYEAANHQISAGTDELVVR
jgi:folylpolyglutamate synthase/dihydropteroate synthase